MSDENNLLLNNPSRNNMISMLSLNPKYNRQQLDVLKTKDLYDLY